MILVWDNGCTKDSLTPCSRRQVEFRAPSQLVGERLVAQHERLADDMAGMFANGCSAGRRALKDTATTEKEHDKTLRRVPARL